MRSVTYSMSASLDGYIVGPDGGFDWGTPDKEVFRFWIDEIREVGVAELFDLTASLRRPRPARPSLSGAIRRRPG